MSPLQSTMSWVQYIAHPPKYLTASLIVSLGGLLNGLDTGTIGPVITMPFFISTFGELPAGLSGIVVSSLLLAGTLSSLFSGPLSDRFGRPTAIAIGALFFAVGAAIEAGASNLGMVIAGRSIIGLGEGLFLITLIVYVCEITPPKERGLLASIVQVFVTIGIMLGYFICYGTVNWGSSLSWRFPIAFQAGIALFLALMSYFYLPQSPRWLSHKGRGQEAIAVWEKLGVLAAEREKDIEQSERVRTLPTVASNGHLGPLGRMRRSARNSIAMFGKGTRKQMLLGVFMMTMQQLSGIDGVLYYAPILFNQAGLSSSQATFLASGVSAILLCVSTILAFMFVDRWGRRATTLYGGLLLFACMSLLGILYATDSVHANYGAGKWAVIITIYIFAITYCMTWGLGVKLFASEIQPIATRAVATSLAQSANCISNFFVALITPILLARSSFGVYFLFAGCALLTVGVCAVFMPETRGESLEAISESFSSRHVTDTALMRGMRNLASIVRRRVGSNRSIPLSGKSQGTNTASSEEVTQSIVMAGGTDGSEEAVEMGIMAVPSMK